MLMSLPETSLSTLSLVETKSTCAFNNSVFLPEIPKLWIDLAQSIIKLLIQILQMLTKQLKFFCKAQKLGQLLMTATKATV